MSIYGNTRFYSDQQAVYIGLCIQNGYDFTYLTKGKFDRDVVKIIYEGIQNNYDLSFLDVFDPELYDENQIREIYKGLDDELDIMLFCDPKIPNYKMHVLRHIIKFDYEQRYIDIKALINLMPSHHQMELVLYFARQCSSTSMLLKRELNNIELSIISHLYDIGKYDIINMIVDNRYSYRTLLIISRAIRTDIDISELLEYTKYEDTFNEIYLCMLHEKPFKFLLNKKWTEGQSAAIYRSLSRTDITNIPKSILNKIFKPQYNSYLIELMYVNHTEIDYILRLNTMCFGSYDSMSTFLNAKKLGLSMEIIDNILNMNLSSDAKHDILITYLTYTKLDKKEGK